MSFTVIGDSNVRRHMVPQNCRDRPHMVGAQVKTCGNFDTFREVLRSVRAETTIVVLACLTNFLTASEGESTSAAVRVEPALIEFKDVLLDFCQEQPERFVNLSIVSLIFLPAS